MLFPEPITISSFAPGSEPVLQLEATLQSPLPPTHATVAALSNGPSAISAKVANVIARRPARGRGRLFILDVGFISKMFPSLQAAEFLEGISQFAPILPGRSVRIVETPESDLVSL